VYIHFKIRTPGLSLIKTMFSADMKAIDLIALVFAGHFVPLRSSSWSAIAQGAAKQKRLVAIY